MSTSVSASSTPSTSTTPVVALPSDTTTTLLTPEVLITRIRNYGYAENTGIARRQQRALTLLTQDHVTSLDLTLTAAGCPIVIRYRVQSEAGEGHYYVTRTPNESTPTYTCTCPDTWQPCKHAYAATLYQTALHLAHTHRGALPPYAAVRASLPENPVVGSHELTAVQVILDLAPHYQALSREAARQYYGAKRSYASSCFSGFIDKARWRYGTGYVGWSDNGVGEIHSVAGTHVFAVHWHTDEVRWYVVSGDGSEDVAGTRHILEATLPHWLQETTTDAHEVSPALVPCFEAEEEPDGHYSPIH